MSINAPDGCMLAHRMMSPEITALLLTRDRLEMTRVSYLMFTKQTYPNKKLLILSDGEPDEIAALNEYTSDARVTLLTTASGKTLGELRNIAVSHASDLSIQWDSDDWYGTDRMQVKYDALGDKAAVLLLEQLHYIADTNEVGWVIDPSGIEGTVLLDRRCGFQYPHISIREDTALKLQLQQLELINVVPGGICYCRVFHGKNTWDRQHHLNRISRRGKTASQLELDWDQLEHAARIYGWPAGWKVVGGNSEMAADNLRYKPVQA